MNLKKVQTKTFDCTVVDWTGSWLQTDGLSRKSMYPSSLGRFFKHVKTSYSSFSFTNYFSIFILFILKWIPPPTLTSAFCVSQTAASSPINRKTHNQESSTKLIMKTETQLQIEVHIKRYLYRINTKNKEKK